MKTSLPLILLVSLWLVACTGAPEAPPPAPADTWFPLSLGGTVVQTQLALNDAERSRGLMHRAELPENNGMLFVFTRPGARSFFMRNTSIPLDIGYFDPQGVLLEIHPLIPFDETPVNSRNDRIQFALEVNRGWFRQNGLRAGVQLDLSEISAAVTQRGFNPDDFRLPSP